MASRRTRYLNSLVEEYLNILTRNKKAKRGTTDEYLRLLTLALDALDVAGLKATPSKIGEDEIYFLQDEYYAHLDPTVNRRQIGIFGTFLKHYNNNIVEKMHLAWPQDLRTNVHWLEAEDCIRLLDAAEGLERILVHLELLLCMRALDRKPEQRVPDQFLIYAQYGWKLGAYEDTAIDKLIKSAAQRAGIPGELVSNHVLRRSGARMYLDAGGSIEDICIMLGHADTRTTMKYLGIDLDRLKKLQDKRDNYLDLVRMEMKQRAAPVTLVTNPTSLFSR